MCLQGYDDIAVLRELPEEQLVDLLLDLGMGQGHSARFRLGVRSARERPLGLTDLNELRVSATCRRVREDIHNDVTAVQSVYSHPGVSTSCPGILH